MDAERDIAKSGLYRRLAEDQDLLTAVLSLRAVASRLAETVSRTLPSFTDHSVRHMDALWSVTDQVLTSVEVERLTTAEAFLLACGFCLHDIGMAYAATETGLNRVRSTPQYESTLARIPEALRSDPSAQERAIASAVRALHAHAAIELAREPVPGTEWYLFEALSVRDAWAVHAGKVAASHHWALEKVERELGAPGSVPLPGGRTGDLGYVASLLRVIDYAHINRERAPAMDRSFRPSLLDESLVHWLAQENIDGPQRDGAELVYLAARPIQNVDAWWLFYEMLKGFDEEIRHVKRYLDQRHSSNGRFSLQGVRGATSPEEAAVFIPTAGFLPIEVNLRTGSIERLVQLLAGESLYGPDPMTAVRELIQNARDAVMLKKATAETEFDRAAYAIPIRVSLKTDGPAPRLEIVDCGVGMSRKVMTDYLISIAADYWSSQFRADFPTAQERGFEPAGKFGIGFLSVFMLGDAVSVESNRLGGERSQLQLRGLGRRGELRTLATPSGSGTKVQVFLRPSVLEFLRPLADAIRVYAPSLPHVLEVEEDGQVQTIQAGWIQDMGADAFHKWTLQAIQVLARNRSGRHRDDGDFDGVERFVRMPWRWRRAHHAGPEVAWTEGWPEFREEGVRLLAAFEGVTLLSLRGLAVQTLATPGFVGIIDLQTALPDVSRRNLLRADISGVLSRATVATRSRVVNNLDALGREGVLVDKLGFIGQCAELYGREVILEASLPWVSLLALPGEVRLVNCADLRAQLAKASSLFLAYGTGPWTAMRRWVGLESGPRLDELAVVLDDSPSGGLGYHSGDEDKVGKLSDLWTRCEATPLFGTLLGLAAEAWQVNLDELLSQDGWRHKGSILWGRLTRP